MIRTVLILAAATSLATAASAQPDEFAKARSACQAYLVNERNVSAHEIRFDDATIANNQVMVTGVLQRGSAQTAPFTCAVSRTGALRGEVAKLDIHWR
jgi:hypothetical protein